MSKHIGGLVVGSHLGEKLCWQGDLCVTKLKYDKLDDKNGNVALDKNNIVCKGWITINKIHLARGTIWGTEISLRYGGKTLWRKCRQSFDSDLRLIYLWQIWVLERLCGSPSTSIDHSLWWRAERKTTQERVRNRSFIRTPTGSLKNPNLSLLYVCHETMEMWGEEQLVLLYSRQ